MLSICARQGRVRSRSDARLVTQLDPLRKRDKLSVFIFVYTRSTAHGQVDSLPIVRGKVFFVVARVIG